MHSPRLKWGLGGLWVDDDNNWQGRVWRRRDGLYGAIVLGTPVDHQFKSETEAREFVEVTYELSRV